MPEEVMPADSKAKVKIDWKTRLANFTQVVTFSTLNPVQEIWEAEIIQMKDETKDHE